MTNHSTLPRDVRSLRRIIVDKETSLAERERLIAVRDAELYAKTLQIEHLKAQLAVLRRARFGRSSEKLDREIEQLELILGELEEGWRRTANVRHGRRMPSVASARSAGIASRSAASRCLIICRASACCMKPRLPARHAAARCCARLARMSPRCWNTCRRSSRWLSTCGRS